MCFIDDADVGRLWAIHFPKREDMKSSVESNMQIKSHLRLSLLIFGLIIGILIGCNRPSASAVKDDSKMSEQWSIRPYQSVGRYQMFSVEAKTGGTTKTLIFRIDTETGNAWKLDAEFSKWTLIQGSNPKDPLGIR